MRLLMFAPRETQLAATLLHGVFLHVHKYVLAKSLTSAISTVLYKGKENCLRERTGALLVTFVNTGQKEAKRWGGGAMVFLNFVEAEFPEH